MNSRTLTAKAKTDAASSLNTIVTTSLASGAATLIVALSIGWLTVGRSAVGREDVLELISNNTP